ncbi:hypothetical protein Tco_1066795 [Tanacetum coccineum]|uniref:Uncharacterized protein n=1 Tax=Tanacetum coccineum TaxID=301880 RepID=A0ABQ5HBE2_9ASTR
MTSKWNKAIGNIMKKQRSGYKCDDVVLLDVITAAIGKELASPEQMASELAIPEQTATGKESSNPFMAGSLPKTIHLCDLLQSDEDSFELQSDEDSEDQSKQGKIDDAEVEVTFIDETSNDARNKNNKISNSN